MLDLTLLRILKVKEHHDRIVPSLPKGALDAKTEVLIKDLGSYLKETGHPVVKMGPFKTYFFTFLHKDLTTEQREYYTKLIDNCEKDVDASTTRAMCNRLVELGFATDVGNQAAAYHRGDEIDILNNVGAIHEQARAQIMSGNSDETFDRSTIGDLLQADDRNDGLSFSLGVLRDSIRPLRSGDLVITAGRPDTGKTSFLTSELTALVQGTPDVSRPVLWFNNEGEGNRIIKRLYNSFLRADSDQLMERYKQGTLDADFKSVKGERRIEVVNCHDWDNVMVEQVIADHNPCLVIFDMIDNIEFKGSMRAGHDSRTDQILEAQYQWARNLGVKYDHPVIATSQVSADAEQQTDTQCYPRMDMLKDSKTGKQGAADLIIMIGRSREPGMDNARFISTPKNKLARAGKQSYIKQQVNFNIHTGRYSDPTS